MRKLIFILLILSFTALYYYSLSTQVAHEPEAAPKNFVQQTLLSVKKMFKNSTEPQVTAKNEVVQAPKSLDQMNAEELKIWVRTQAPHLDSTENNTEKMQIELAAEARTLKSEQLQELKNLILNLQEASNSRIFAGYMLTLSQSPTTSTQLYDVAQSSVPNFGPVLAHSEAELRHSQELALRYMQVDELYERAKTDANSRDKLKLLSTAASSLEVRNYALRKLKELK